MDDNEKTRLRTRLGYWIGHNMEHSQEFKEWAGIARASGEIEAGNDMLLAAEEMDKASEILSQALKRLSKEEQ